MQLYSGAIGLSVVVTSGVCESTSKKLVPRLALPILGSRIDYFLKFLPSAVSPESIKFILHHGLFK